MLTPSALKLPLLAPRHILNLETGHSPAVSLHQINHRSNSLLQRSKLPVSHLAKLNCENPNLDFERPPGTECRRQKIPESLRIVTVVSNLASIASWDPPSSPNPNRPFSIPVANQYPEQ